MANIKGRIQRLEANTPACGAEQVTEIHRVIVGQFNADGTNRVLVRKILSD